MMFTGAHGRKRAGNGQSGSQRSRNLRNQEVCLFMKRTKFLQLLNWLNFRLRVKPDLWSAIIKDICLLLVCICYRLATKHPIDHYLVGSPRHPVITIRTTTIRRRSLQAAHIEQLSTSPTTMSHFYRRQEAETYRTDVEALSSTKGMQNGTT